MKKKPEATKENQPRSPKIPAGGHAQSEDVVDLILHDHKPLKKLIETLKDPVFGRAEKESAFEKFVPLLVAHAKSEEKSLYVQMKEMKQFRREGFEGDTEHGLAEQLVHEINGTPDDDEWNAKVKVLADLVETHIKEEEETMLPKIEEAMDLSVRQAVGEIYTELKSELDLLNHPRKVPRHSVTEQRLN